MSTIAEVTLPAAKFALHETLDDLADEPDISHQALSERLHRGHKTPIENALVVGRMG